MTGHVHYKHLIEALSVYTSGKQNAEIFGFLMLQHACFSIMKHHWIVCVCVCWLLCTTYFFCQYAFPWWHTLTRTHTPHTRVFPVAVWSHILSILSASVRLEKLIGRGERREDTHTHTPTPQMEPHSSLSYSLLLYTHRDMCVCVQHSLG